MDYQPSLPEHNDNVSHQHPLREFGLILSALIAIALLAFWFLGLLIDVAVDHMSAETEAAINKAVTFDFPKEASFAPDRAALLQTLAEELRQCAGVTYPITVYLHKSDQANAAVFAGGHVIVFSGVFDKIASRNGLAFVLAHELAHLKHRDHLRAMGRSLLLVAIAATLTGSHSDITQVLMPINQISTATYSQEREAQADQAALRSIACLFGHVGGATEFFEGLKNDEDESSVWLSHYFASHPQLQARIDKLNRTIREMQLQAGAVQRLDARMLN